MATMRVGIAEMRLMMGMKRINELKRLVSMARVAGSRRGARLASNVGK